jgi:hypothetical protein
VMLRTSWLRLLIYMNLFVVRYHVAFPLRSQKLRFEYKNFRSHNSPDRFMEPKSHTGEGDRS